MAKSQRIIHQGREYRQAKGSCSECPLRLMVEACYGTPREAIPFCGPSGAILRETIRSRLSHWWREWVKRNIVDDDPNPESDLPPMESEDRR